MTRNLKTGCFLKKLGLMISAFYVVLIASSQVQVDYSSDLEEFLKIFNFLEEAARYRQEKGRFQGRVAEFGEKEVTAFFRYLLAEQVPSVKNLELKFKPKGRVEGSIYLSLPEVPRSGMKASEINLSFSGRIETSSNKVRLNFYSLLLEKQPVRPEVINILISLVARIRGIEPRYLGHWYALPEGISDLETGEGKLLVRY